MGVILQQTPFPISKTQLGLIQPKLSERCLFQATEQTQAGSGFDATTQLHLECLEERQRSTVRQPGQVPVQLGDVLGGNALQEFEQLSEQGRGQIGLQATTFSAFRINIPETIEQQPNRRLRLTLEAGILETVLIHLPTKGNRTRIPDMQLDLSLT